ncbi:hypothetical protein BD560DRAFT_472897 [Blakeslea trispora]|nr:hypothetical protein BD560DRAFT_472897 [Blakeslea trispora]
MTYFRKALPLIIIYFVAVAQVGCRCICDSVDTLCLYNCVKTTHDCIIDCQDAVCYSQCIQVHWPGIMDTNSSTNHLTSSPTISKDVHKSMVDQSITMASETRNSATTPMAQSEISDLVFTVHTTVIRLTTVTPMANTMSTISPALQPSVISLSSKATKNPVFCLIFAACTFAFHILF